MVRKGLVQERRLLSVGEMGEHRSHIHLCKSQASSANLL